MSIARHHTEWLSLLDISGPFLSLPVLMRALPQGLEARDVEDVRNLRAAYGEWLDNQLGLTPEPAIHRAWIDYVLVDLLGYDDETLRAADQADLAPWSVRLPEHQETLTPDLVVVNPAGSEDAGTARLLIQIVPHDQALDKPLPDHNWLATPAARMQELLHGADVRLGLVTNGEQWMLVDAPRGETTGYISWYTELWFDEPLTLRAWTTLLGVQRFFGVPDNETLAALLAESAQFQHEVTDQLGLQVRHAVELLVQAIDSADRERQGALMADVPLSDLYQAAVTVMMRLVFLMSAEEQRLLPMDDQFYATYYAVSTQQEQLRTAADQTGEQVLEYRDDAWPRLLATFRAVHGGVYHDRWHMPAYGGGLFDPDRFAFLEGRAAGDAGRNHASLRISNRVVLHLLEALQLLRVDVPGGGKQTRRLSFRGLDIEQIGHVYEGLLDHTAVRAATPVLGLAGTKDKEPEIDLRELERRAGKERDLLTFLKEETGRSESALTNGLQAPPPDLLRAQQLRAACNNDDALYQRVLPWHGLVRDDDYDRPVIINAGSVYVTSGSARRATGTHYTPRSLTEPIVQHTLEPLVYVGPAQGKPRDAWALRPPQELLDLNICDMAMGSGAFLVQVDRYLAERLVEAWDRAERRLRADRGRRVRITPLGAATSDGDKALPDLPEERLLLARRLVADRCLYGVDKNPLAVEMAKLSLWLITLDKGKPFTFLDHALKCGDSLVGLHSLEQLRCWNLEGAGARQFSTVGLDVDIEQMVALRREIEAMPVLDIRDQQAKRAMLTKAEGLAHELKRSADMLIASYYNTLGKKEQATLRDALLAVAKDGASLDPQWHEHADLVDPSAGTDTPLTPFHWPLEFPEIFVADDRQGFDAFVGNPPFIGGKRIRSALGTEAQLAIKMLFNRSKGAADYVAYFFRQAFRLCRRPGFLGLIATKSISETDTRMVGLQPIVSDGGVLYRVESSIRWPGTAGVYVSVVHIAKAPFYARRILDGVPSSYLSSRFDSLPDSEPERLVRYSSRYSEGVKLNGAGFVIEPSEYRTLMEEDSRNSEVLQPYLNSEIYNSLYDLSEPAAYVINFGHRGKEEAETYSAPFKLVQERVRPQRKAMTGQIHEHRFWLHWDKRTNFFHRFQDMTHFLVLPITSKYLTFSRFPKSWFFSHAVKIFAFDGFQEFCILQSTLHDVWTRRESSNLSTTLRYSTSDAFDTFPFPLNYVQLEAIGEEYHQIRQHLLYDLQIGMTDLYNRFHDPDETAADIVRLRELHVAMDHAVAAAYGWAELSLGHGFHETQQGLRYTIHDDARREVLTRLLALNHERYAEEVKAGLHGKGKKSTGLKKVSTDEQMSLFAEPNN